jgi:hypothetical protein
MAAADVATYLKGWLQSSQDWERKQKKMLLTGIDEITALKSDFHSKIKKGKNVNELTVRWQERSGYSINCTAALSTTTLTLSGNLMGAAITEAAARDTVQVGTVLERMSDHQQVKVSAVISYAAYTFTVGIHGNTATGSLVDSAAGDWEIIGDASSDYNTEHTPRSVDTIFRKVGTQIHEETFEFPHTWLNTAFENISDNVADQVNLLTNHLRLKIARSCLRMSPTYSAGYVTGHSVESPTMTGLVHWPRLVQAELSNTNVYVNMNSVEIDLPTMDNVVYYMEGDEKADFSTGNWYLLCHPVQAMYLGNMLMDLRRMTLEQTKVGAQVNVFQSKLGKSFEILPDWNMQKDMIAFVNTSPMSWGYYAGDDIWTKDLATQNRSERRLITCQTYGLVVRKPRSNIGVIYGLPTTYA